MKTIWMIAIVLGLISSGLVLGEDTPDSESPVVSEALQSPYFIDEVHCEGIRTGKVMGSWFRNEEEEQQVELVSAQETCETTLKLFGIEKYQWISPEDLERTSILISNSGIFKSVHLSVKKSELRNHVHLFFKGKPRPKYFYSVGNHFKYYRAKGASSQNSRISNELLGDITFYSQAPETINHVGFDFERTNLGTNSQTSKFLGTGFLNVYFKHDFRISKTFNSDFSAHLFSDNYYPDQRTRGQFSIDTHVFHEKSVALLRGSSYFGLGTMLAGENVLVSSEHPGSLRYTQKMVFLPGLLAGYQYGEDSWNHLKFGGSFYHSTKDHWILEYKLSGQLHENLFDTFFVGEFGTRLINHAFLPADRLFPSQNIERSFASLGISKYFKDSADTRHQFSAFFGTEAVRDRNIGTKVTDTAPSLGLKYKLISETWNIDLSAAYFFSRSY